MSSQSFFSAARSVLRGLFSSIGVDVGESKLSEPDRAAAARRDGENLKRRIELEVGRLRHCLCEWCRCGVQLNEPDDDTQLQWHQVGSSFQDELGSPVRFSIRRVCHAAIWIDMIKSRTATADDIIRSVRDLT